MGLCLVNPCTPHKWKTSQRTHYSWRWDLGEGYLVVPAGYECDGASIPFIFYNVVDPISALIGAFLHDLLYQTQYGLRPGIIKLESSPVTGDFHERRERADSLLKAAWIASGMTFEMAEKGFLAVRLCGRPAWNSEEPLPLIPAMKAAYKATH